MARDDSKSTARICLGFLLYNIYPNDLFYLDESTNVCNFINSTTFYACDKDLFFFIYRSDDSYLATKLFKSNSMKLFQDKCHLLVLRFVYENVWANIGKTKIWESKRQKMLNVQIYWTLSFNEYIASLCRKAGNKLLALERLLSFMCKSFNERVLMREILMKAFIESQFDYCPLFWMFHSRGVNSKINQVHERSLRSVYEDNISSFEESLKRDKSFNTHQTNIQSLAIELFKIKGNLSNNIMYEILGLQKLTATWGHKPILEVNV